MRGLTEDRGSIGNDDSHQNWGSTCPDGDGTRHPRRFREGLLVMPPGFRPGLFAVRGGAPFDKKPPAGAGGMTRGATYRLQS